MNREDHILLHSKLCIAKAVSIEYCLIKKSEWKREGLIIGFTNGCFDLLHPGHIWFLEQCKQKCDKLIIAINSDSSITKLKGRNRPILNQRERTILIAALASTDLVITFEETTPLSLIERLQPDCLFKGSDYSVESIVGYDEVTSSSGRVLLADNVGFSTTEIIDRIASKYGKTSK